MNIKDHKSEVEWCYKNFHRDLKQNHYKITEHCPICGEAMTFEESNNFGFTNSYKSFWYGKKVCAKCHLIDFVSIGEEDYLLVNGFIMSQYFEQDLLITEDSEAKYIVAGLMGI